MERGNGFGTKLVEMLKFLFKSRIYGSLTYDFSSVLLVFDEGLV